MSWFLSVLTFLCLSLIFNNCASQQVQEPRANIANWVVDEAEVLSDDDESMLSGLLSSHYENSTVQIICVTTANLNNTPVRDYTLSLANSWGVGTAGVNNGIVILIAPNERQYSIDIGSGLEWQISDSTASVIGQQMVSYLREGEYYNSFKTASEQIIELSNLVSWHVMYRSIGELTSEPLKSTGQIVTFTAVITMNSDDHFLVLVEEGFEATILKTKYTDQAWPNILVGNEYRFFTRVQSVDPLTLLTLGLKSPDQ